MPCSDSSSSISIRVDERGHLVNFEFGKITCGKEIAADTQYARYCHGRSLENILQIGFDQLIKEIKVKDDEQKFVMYLEWDALRSAIAQYLGLHTEGIDVDRCRISSIEYHENGVEINEVILPPKSLPKILPCDLAKNN